jgi:hypothetical protein
MGLFETLKKLISGEPDESLEYKEARQLMHRDAQEDPRRAAVFGVLAISWDVDPGYIEEARIALRDWYGVSSKEKILSYRFRSNSSPAYNAYRMTFLARAGFAAGYLTEPESWNLCMVQLKIIAEQYDDFPAYGYGYLAGHLEHRATQKDSPEELQKTRHTLIVRIEKMRRNIWRNMNLKSEL